MEKEIRTLQLNVRDLQENPQSRHIEGYAVVFNSESVDLGGFREVILPTAITQGLIERSDVFMVFQHDMDKVLARSRNGEGSLKLTLYDHGLRFAFDAPNTDLGNEVLEYLRRGDVGECSFAFALDPNDKEADVWEKREDGSILRTINRIAGLYDCSIVWNAAYPQTSVSARSLEKIEELRADEKPEDEEEKPVEGEDTPNEDNTPNEGEEKPAEETPAEEEPTSSEDESNPEEDLPTPAEGEDNPNEDNTSSEEEPTPNEGEDTPEDEEEKRKKNKQTHTHNIMEKRFSLLKSIRDIANGQPLSPENQAVSDLGKQEMRGLTVSGQIQIPTESRAVTVTAEGEDVVVTDFMDILAPLHSKNVLAESGAKILTGLVGDVQIPTMSAGQVGWKGEIVSADELGSTFDHALLQPKRLTAYVDVSKQFLVQDSLGAEQMLRQELVDAMVQKLEDTIFGTAAGDATKPAGIFYGKTATSVTNFAGIANLEATVENANFLGEMKYVVSPNAKAALRAMGYANKSTRQVWENNEVDGVPALTTTHIANPTFAYGDWSNLVVGNWGAWDLVVDPYSVAKDGKVRIVINAFFDAKMVRDGAIAYGTIGQ